MYPGRVSRWGSSPPRFRADFWYRVKNPVVFIIAKRTRIIVARARTCLYSDVLSFSTVIQEKSPYIAMNKDPMRRVVWGLSGKTSQIPLLHIMSWFISVYDMSQSIS